MENIYVLVYDHCAWEDLVMVNTLEEAIEISAKNPGGRVEIFSKKKGSKNGVYHPTYNYWKGGRYFETTPTEKFTPSLMIQSIQP
jgi:hypothetical protein